MAEDTGYEATTSETVGERLRAARLAEGISLEDIAARTRIPTRHLESLEASDWSKLPAATYSIGFAKSYASAVGLDRTEIGEALRTEMGRQPTRTSPSSEVYEPVDPARVMPKWLVFAAIVAVLALVAGLLFARDRGLNGGDDAQPVEAAAPAQTSGPSPTPAPTPVAASGPVVITANEPTWIMVSEKGGASLFQGELAAGQSYQVPATATAPVLKTGRPESIRIAVGTADAPAVGPAATTVRDVSLLPADLMRGGAATPPAGTPAPRP
jgi:cytoskeletal protein RodZ